MDDYKEMHLFSLSSFLVSVSCVSSFCSKDLYLVFLNRLKINSLFKLIYVFLHIDAQRSPAGLARHFLCGKVLLGRKVPTYLWCLPKNNKETVISQSLGLLNLMFPSKT